MKCFTCDACGGHFTSARTEEEAHAERVANGFGDLPEEELARVCDDCYEELMALNTPRSTITALVSAAHIKPRRRRRGKRARRASFYSRAKVCRRLQAVLNSIDLSEIDGAIADMLVHGIGWVQYSDTGPVHISAQSIGLEP